MVDTSIGFDTATFADAAAALERRGFDRLAGRLVAGALRKSANKVRTKTRAAARPHRKSGKMAGRIRTRFSGSGMGFVAIVKAESPVSHLIIGGVRAHDIPLKEKRVLSSGIETFGSVVRHPGFSGDPFFARGVQDSMPDVNGYLRDAGEKMAGELALKMKRR